MTDLTRLKELTEELAREVKNNICAGPLFKLLTQYFEEFETLVCIIRADKYVLYMNKATQDKIRSLGVNPSIYINAPCIGNLENNCPLKGNCPIDECKEQKKVVVRSNVKSPISNNIYDLVCLPLRYNGVSAVIEMWVEK